MTTHTMIFTSKPGCPDELHCPVCGRRLLVTWEPYSRTVLSVGDETAWHTTSSGGVTISGLDTNSDTRRMNDVAEALDRMGFEELWK